MSMGTATRREDLTVSLGRHSDIDYNVTFKIASLEGNFPQRPLIELLDEPGLRHAGAQQALPSDLYIVISLWADNKPLAPKIQTSHKTFDSKSKYIWNETLSFPINIRDLPRSAQLALTVYDTGGPQSVVVVGGSTIALFGRKNTLKNGQQRLYLWKGQVADGSFATKTSSKVEQKDEMGRLEKLIRKHERGEIPSMDWLDKLAIPQMEETHAIEALKSDDFFLYIDLPKFEFPVVFSEVEYPLTFFRAKAPIGSMLHFNDSPTTSSSHPTDSISKIRAKISDPRLFAILDPEVARQNPVEAKHRRLVRNHRSGPLDRERRPNAKIRDELDEILFYPPTQSLTPLQRDLIWQFRFYLTRKKRALTKFLKSVVWSDPGEMKQVIEELLPIWAEIEMDDALELLGPGEAFKDNRVRAYAVNRLGKADDDELMLYLLQLVQSLKLEFEVPGPRSPESSLLQSRHSSVQPIVHAGGGPLASFLISRSIANPVLGNHFNWYISVECEDPTFGSKFKEVKKRFMLGMNLVPEEGAIDRQELMRRQAELVSRISLLAREIRLSKDTRPKKIEKLRAILSDSRSGLGSFPSLPLPLDARKSIIGIDPEKSSVFKSNLFPLQLHFLCDDGSSYPVIFKNGDDLRQDQLVIQLFTLMQGLLGKENLDLKLMPYRVLATAALDGMVQFIPSKTLQDISNEYGGDLLAYLRKFHPDPASEDTYGLDSVVFDTYIRSCAGYCVLTYLLGVGDRHLDNLLLSTKGHFFHVDFGYILGNDPKPMAPAVKICKEMVDAMGGVHSPHYAKFKGHCYTGFTILRRHANLIINLVALMIVANIPDIKREPDQAVRKVQDKFLLNLTEEEALKAFEALLNETSYFSSVLDRIHAVAQYWRS